MVRTEYEMELPLAASTNNKTLALYVLSTTATTLYTWTIMSTSPALTGGPTPPLSLAGEPPPPSPHAGAQITLEQATTRLAETVF